MAIETLNQLMAATATHLAKHPVIVRDRKPPYKGRDGTAYLKSGVGVIDVNPDLPGDDRLFVCLHEAAHIAQSWGDVSAMNPIHMFFPEASIDARQYDALKSRIPNIAANEFRAEMLCRKWLDYANSHYKNYGDDSWTLWVRKLWALLDYPGG